MSQPIPPSDGLPTMGTVPLGPDEPELFTDAMERIIRHLGADPARPGVRQAGPRPPAPRNPRGRGR